MSLLSSFASDFNATITIDRESNTKSSRGDPVSTFASIATGVSCLIFLNRRQPNQTLEGDMQYTKSTHKLRMELWVDVKEDDRVTDQKGNIYRVVFSYDQPGFWGDDDHILLFLDLVK